MIISASRRTDIPAFYSEWMLRRLKEGRVLVPYPRNPAKLAALNLSPDNVDCIVFWTKNPAPMLEKLKHLDAMGYCYYFSFTVTGYGSDIERSLPPKEEVINTFLKLSELIGPERVDWRFDPIIVNGRYTVQWHLDTFAKMCQRLKGASQRCIMNFIKSYRHLPNIKELDETVIIRLAQGMAQIAGEYGVSLYNCTEKWDLRKTGISFSSCIDKTKIEKIIGYAIKAGKDPGQPSVCRCMQSIDIGIYDSCANGCVYCYATASQARLQRNLAAHDPWSPVLIGQPGDRVVIDRTGFSLRDNQLKMNLP